MSKFLYKLAIFCLAITYSSATFTSLRHRFEVDFLQGEYYPTIQRIDTRAGNAEQKIEALTTGLNSLEEKILTQLQNLQTSLQSNIDTVKTTSDQCSANADQIKQKTDAGLASASEEIKNLMEELRKEREEREKLMKQIEAEKEGAKKRKKFEKRFNHALFDLYNLGRPRDSVMSKLFEEAYKESPKFKKLLDFLKSGPEIIEQMMEAENQLENALLKFLDEHEEWQEALYATIQLDLAIGDGTEQPAIEDPDDNNSDGDSVNESEPEAKKDL